MKRLKNDSAVTFVKRALVRKLSMFAEEKKNFSVTFRMERKTFCRVYNRVNMKNYHIKRALDDAHLLHDKRHVVEASTMSGLNSRHFSLCLYFIIPLSSRKSSIFDVEKATVA